MVPSFSKKEYFQNSTNQGWDELLVLIYVGGTEDRDVYV